MIEKIQFLLNTLKGSIPIDRDFGVSQLYLDETTEEAKAEFTAEIMEAIGKYIDCDVEEITYKATENGKLKPIVRLANE